MSLSTEAYRDDPNNESDDTSTNATTASSDLTGDTSTASGREGEMSSDVTNSTSSSWETVEDLNENMSSVDAGSCLDNFVHKFPGTSVFIGKL